MIRFAWVALNTALATLVFGLVAIVASLLRVRGRVYHWATQQWSLAILWASRTPVTTHGMERVDWSRPIVLVANHLSNYDIFAIAGVLPVPFAFVAKKELERIPFFGTAWKSAGHISIDRSDRQRAVQSLRVAGERIRREHSTVIIFPEGTRSRSGELQPFKKGAFVLAMEADATVVPVAILGSDRIVRMDSFSIRPHPIHLHFGEPIAPGAVSGGTDALLHAARSQMEALLEAHT